jgi:hypothetical protein
MAKPLRASLQNSPTGPLKEMADSVLAGNIDLRQAAMSDAYSTDLGAAFDQFAHYCAPLDDRERDRDEVVATIQHQLDELLDRPATGPA